MGPYFPDHKMLQNNKYKSQIFRQIWSHTEFTHSHIYQNIKYTPQLFLENTREKSVPYNPQNIVLSSRDNRNICWGCAGSETAILYIYETNNAVSSKGGINSSAQTELDKTFCQVEFFPCPQLVCIIKAAE